jgi:hypothetical protein
MKRCFISILLLGMLVPVAGANPGPAAALDLPAYTQELRRWATAAGRLGEHPEEAAALRRQLPGQWSVTWKEQQFQVSTQWLSSALDELAADHKLAKEASREIGVRLQGMLRDCERLATSPDANAPVARAKLNDILKRREFRSVGAPVERESFWERLEDRLLRLLVRLFSGVGSHPGAKRVVLWFVVVALGLAFLAWLIHSLAGASFRSLRRPPVRQVRAAETGTWQEWAQKARAAAERGDYRDAVRIVYGAAVLRLAVAGVWQIDPARTHREYVRLLAADAAQRAPLVALTTLFEAVWYGRAEASAGSYAAAQAELESLR